MMSEYQPVIERQPALAATKHYDLVVVGGGVYGIALTLEAARRGLRPLLVERSDFGHATSWNSLRILHGGLRYLQTFDLGRHQRSVAERAWFLRHFPELVEPLPCLMPLYGEGLKRRSVFRMALRLDAMLARHHGRLLPKGGVLAAAATMERCPHLEPRGLRGGGLWYDAFAPRSQRLLMEMLRWAVRYGATALNRIEVRSLLQAKDGVDGVEALDHTTGTTLRLRAPVVVGCAGPWARQLAARLHRDFEPLFRPSLAMNVLLDRPPPADAALAVTARIEDGRTYFLVPFESPGAPPRTLAGTFHTSLPAGELPTEVDDSHLQTFLRHLNVALPYLEAGPERVIRLFWGLLPAAYTGSAELALRPVIYHHRDTGGPRGFYSVSGIKLTTARRVAELTLARIFADRGETLPLKGLTPRPEPAPCMTAHKLADLFEHAPEHAAEHVRRLATEESVLEADDLLFRRSDWGLDPDLGESLAIRVAQVLER